MGKRVQVVLNRDVSKLGRSGDLVDVAPGYARNYLLPQGFAVNATPSILRQVELRRQKELERLAEIKRQAEAQKVALATIGRLTIQKQTGEGDAIFGTVTSQEVADTLLEKAGQQVDKRNITIPDIDGTGTYDVEIKLHPEVTAIVQIEVAAK
ncbi:MAG: 50S ribosomal protein L9 [Spirulinaceae cyanobacterium RM2_2_10]|nr:50S ribosomal protein L9 [Spirulinaceae cyanobacterium SM2_1_0]NJO19910.1 50S ribosomal protein L9 [Spirulinaceae cyanobacterium RM2_2_10]